MRFGGKIDGRRTLIQFDNGDFRGALGKKLPYRLQAHAALHKKRR